MSKRDSALVIQDSGRQSLVRPDRKIAALDQRHFAHCFFEVLTFISNSTCFFKSQGLIWSIDIEFRFVPAPCWRIENQDGQNE